MTASGDEATQACAADRRAATLTCRLTRNDRSSWVIYFGRQTSAANDKLLIQPFICGSIRSVKSGDPLLGISLKLGKVFIKRISFRSNLLRVYGPGSCAADITLSARNASLIG